jgi:KDO2-lipid IV(A) lauroyltransferase
MDPDLSRSDTPSAPDSAVRNGAPPSGAVPRPDSFPVHNGRARRESTLKLGPMSRAVYWAMLATLHALSLIPDVILYPLGTFGGLVAYWLDRRHVAIGMKNLGIAFRDKSEAERRAILRASYINLGRSASEYVRLGGFFYRRLKDRVRYQRLEYWDEISAKYPGKGILILTAHFGNFELLPAAHAMHGYQISLVHHTQRFLAGDAMLSYVRERAGVDAIRKHSAARAVLKALREGDLVGIPFDQNAKRSEAIFVPFFGEPAATASGLGRLLILSGAPVVPVFIVREGDGRHHRIEIQDEIPVQRSSDPDADLVENTRRFVKAVEDMVRRYPEQFLWTHRRFRTRPRGMAPIYDR